MMIVWELKESDWCNHKESCMSFLKNVPIDAVVLFSDVAHFYLSGLINKHNVWYWVIENPWEFYNHSTVGMLLFGVTCIYSKTASQAGCDTRSIFKWSLTGLNSEFSFS